MQDLSMSNEKTDTRVMCESAVISCGLLLLWLGFDYAFFTVAGDWFDDSGPAWKGYAGIAVLVAALGIIFTLGGYLYGRLRKPGNEAGSMVAGSLIGGLLFALIVHLTVSGPSPFRSPDILLNLLLMVGLSTMLWLAARYAQRGNSPAPDGTSVSSKC